ncbi:hypothetical protein HRG_001171 [Hirsutella rhossiliensis]|uniref:Uncharacterized protein n=1 Tax=Hirsutella rhossiliensis TaxID=111463 RepID=A0A9P8N873_9HYPO|nr:uncharacterized protein HRG_01171 [Hirsutella rhossiliensis]KAH0968529.1 hypothetical protein HRG_01171 [Hirsutella rhossiliensis]
MQSSTFTIAAEPSTDIWKKPPSHNVFNAPFRAHSKRPTSSFLSATLTFSALYTLQYDQAGILLIFTNKHEPSARKWIKAGIELFDGLPRLSTVCCDAWADWSVAPAPDESAVAAGRRPVTLRIETHRGSSGTSLWVYHVDDAGSQAKKNPMREVCWPFGESASDGWELEVAAAVARPAKDAKDKLEARFDGFDVQWE